MKTKWIRFFEESINSILENKGCILDIGGGLRITKSKSNRFNLERYKLFGKSLDDKDVDYLVMDYKVDYNPDIVGDIHAIPMQAKELLSNVVFYDYAACLTPSINFTPFSTSLINSYPCNLCHFFSAA